MEIPIPGKTVFILSWIVPDSFSATASISAQPRWLYLYCWVAEVFHMPQCAVILLHDKASKNGTGNGSWRQGIKGEMTCTVYVALVWIIIYWIIIIMIIIIIIMIIMMMMMIMKMIMKMIMIMIIIIIIIIIMTMTITITITMITKIRMMTMMIIGQQQWW